MKSIEELYSLFNFNENGRTFHRLCHIFIQTQINRYLYLMQINISKFFASQVRRKTGQKTKLKFLINQRICLLVYYS